MWSAEVPGVTNGHTFRGHKVYIAKSLISGYPTINRKSVSAQYHASSLGSI